MREKIHAAMLSVMREVGAIEKGSRNAQQGFMFRGIDAVYGALHRLMAKHGIYSTSEILSATREERTTAKGGLLAFSILHIRYRFITEDGSSVTTEVVGEGADYGDKATNKAMAIGHKYALLQAFLVPTEEIPDPDAESQEIAPAKINSAQLDELVDLASAAGADIENICVYYKIMKLGDLPSAKFQELLSMLQRRKSAKSSVGK